ncbi:DNA cytosine methyltransferase [Acinetobacter sp. ANC 4193]
MKYGSVCSGIEAITVAWHSLGMDAAWYSEIEKFPSKVLEHHYPEVANLGDMTKIADMVKNQQVEAPEILVGGTPCQAFSVAGLRNSLSDDRGQLTLEFVRLANEIDTARSIRGSKPAIILWENVPGVLSTKDNAFGCFLGALSGAGCKLQPTGRKWSNAGCVFGPQRQVYWRILDAKYFGLAQRRKRVFVVASARTECIREILFEFQSVSGNFEESQSKRESLARSCENNTRNASRTVSGKTYTPPILASHGQKKWLGNQEAFCGDYYIQHTIGIGGMMANAAISNEIYPTILASCDRGYLITYGIQGNIIGRSINAGGNGIGFKAEQAPTLTSMDRHGVLYCGTKNDYLRDLALNVAPTLRTGGKGGGAINQAIFQYMPSHIFHAARYLTEIECERLQGFPDNYTSIPKAASTLRYKALGNSMAVPVMKWIGERIQKYLESAHE